MISDKPDIPDVDVNCISGKDYRNKNISKDNINCNYIEKDYIGISTTFPCRWKYENGVFKEERSAEHGVAGFFLFHDKSILEGIPESGELVRWMQEKGMHIMRGQTEGEEPTRDVRAPKRVVVVDNRKRK